MADAPATKTAVTVIQGPNGETVGLRINGAEIPGILHAGPVQGVGKTNYALTIENVTIDYEAAPPAA